MSTQLHQQMIAAMSKWVDTVIIKFNFCPFARNAVENNGIRYQVMEHRHLDALLDNIEAECQYLDSHDDTETTLLVLASGFEDFENYLDLVDLAQSQIIDPQYEGIYQLASFHPQYCFAGAPEDDPANFTNRSPFPALHLIREDSISKALQHYPEPEKIPDRNIALARRKGAKKMAELLDQCQANNESHNPHQF